MGAVELVDAGAGVDADVADAHREDEAAGGGSGQRGGDVAGGASALAHAGDLVLDHGMTPPEKVDDQLELVVGVGGVGVRSALRNRAEDGVELRRAAPEFLVGEGPDDDAAAVRRVAVAAHERGLLETVDHPGDRSGGQAGALGELACGHRPGRGEDPEALEVGAVHPQALGDRLGEEHELAPEPSPFLGELAVQLRASVRSWHRPFRLLE